MKCTQWPVLKSIDHSNERTVPRRPAVCCTERVGSARASRRLAVHAASDVQNRKFSKKINLQRVLRMQPGLGHVNDNFTYDISEYLFT